MDGYIRTFAGNSDVLKEKGHEVVYEAFETTSIGTAREAREKLKSSLIILRKIWEHEACDLGLF